MEAKESHHFFKNTRISPSDHCSSLISNWFNHRWKVLCFCGWKMKPNDFPALKVVVNTSELSGGSLCLWLTLNSDHNWQKRFVNPKLSVLLFYSLSQFIFLTFCLISTWTLWLLTSSPLPVSSLCTRLVFAFCGLCWRLNSRKPKCWSVALFGPFGFRLALPLPDLPENTCAKRGFDFNHGFSHRTSQKTFHFFFFFSSRFLGAMFEFDSRWFVFALITKSFSLSFDSLTDWFLPLWSMQIILWCPPPPPSSPSC